MKRRTLDVRDRDFFFPQQTDPALFGTTWQPTFIDYLFVSYTNSAAFSPTDTMPLSRWAKVLMLVAVGGQPDARSDGRRARRQHSPLVLLGLGHLDLVCGDLARSLAFYRAVFGPLGLEEPALFDGERGEQIHYLRFPPPARDRSGCARHSRHRSSSSTRRGCITSRSRSRRGRTSTPHMLRRSRPGRRCSTRRGSGRSIAPTTTRRSSSIRTGSGSRWRWRGTPESSRASCRRAGRGTRPDSARSEALRPLPRRRGRLRAHRAGQR